MPENAFRKHVDGRLAGLRQDRSSFFYHWNELAKYILPRRYKWLVTPNQYNKGSSINQMIRNNTGTLAARTLSAGMMSGITSPTRPWFRLQIKGYDTDTTSPVTLWLEEVKHRILRVLAESNFYNSIANVYLDLVVFGTAVMLVYEDYDDIIRCYNPCAGEYYLANSDRLYVNTMYREIVQTVSQMLEWFPEERLSDRVRRAAKQGGSALSQEVKIIHAVEPNMDGRFDVPMQFAYREIYYEADQENFGPLKVGGFFEFPGICPRWDIVGNDAYGRSPGMDALADIKQLQVQTLRKAQGIDKMVNPPMVADAQLRNQPASMLPGGVTYLSGGVTGVGFKPAYLVNPQLQDLTADMKEVEERIRITFHNDLFLMISQLDTVRTATEIDARREEKLVLLGPVLTRFNDEALDPAIKRVFNVMLRNQLLPPPPLEIQGQEIEISYVSMLQEVQRAVATTAIERVLSIAGGIAAIQPDVMDNIDTDETIDEYANLLDTSPRIIRSRKDVIALRVQRAEAEANAAALEAVPLAVDAAKTLSETPVGAGQSALNMILQGEGLPTARPI